MGESAIVLANGRVVRKKIKVNEEVIPITDVKYFSDGTVNLFSFSIKGIKIDFIPLFNRDRERKFRCYFMAKEYYRFKSKGVEIHVDNQEYKQYILNDSWFIDAVNGDVIYTEKFIRENFNSNDLNTHRFGSVGYSFIYNSSSHKFTQSTGVSVAYNSPSSTIMVENFISSSSELGNFYKVNASKIGVDKQELAKTAYLIDNFKKVDSDYYKFLQDTNMLPLMQNQLNDFASQQELSTFYSYTNSDFVAYQNWLINYQQIFKYHYDNIKKLSASKQLVIAVSFFNKYAFAGVSLSQKVQILTELSTSKDLEYLMKLFYQDERNRLALEIILSIKENEINEFLDLLLGKVGKYPLFSLLYLSFDQDLKKKFGIKILEFWMKSKFNPYDSFGVLVQDRYKQYIYKENISPKTLNYQSNGNNGFYANNYSFEFDGSNINVISRSPKPSAGSNTNGSVSFSGNISEENKKIGTYGIFQPVSLADISFNSEIRMPVLGNGNAEDINNLIPIFFVKLVDDINDYTTLKNQVGLFVDVALTFTGIGNLSKLRHLKDLPRIARFCAVVGSFDTVLGALDIMFRYGMNNCDNGSNEFCKRLHNYLFCLQLVTGASDMVGNFALMRTATALKELDSLYPTGFDQTCKDIINNHSLMSSEVVANFVKNRKAQILERIRANRSFWDDWYTSEQITDLLEHGISLRMSPDEIEDFIYVGSRLAKTIPYNELRTQMSNWKNIIEPRGFPFKFYDKPAYNLFCTRVKSLLSEFNIPTDKVYIQGSSLRKTTPDDIDIAVFLSEEQFKDFEQLILLNHKNARAEGKVKLSLSEFKSDLKGAVRRGKIDPDYFKHPSNQKNIKYWAESPRNGVDHIFDDVADFTVTPNNVVNKQYKLNLSIIFEGKQYDVGPYLKID